MTSGLYYGDTMDAEIHTIDHGRGDSEGNRLYIRGAKIGVTVGRHEGLPLGDHRDQHFLKIRGYGTEGHTRSTLTATLNADDLQQLFEHAVRAKLVGPALSQRALGLLQQFLQELGGTDAIARDS